LLHRETSPLDQAAHWRFPRNWPVYLVQAIKPILLGSYCSLLKKRGRLSEHTARDAPKPDARSRTRGDRSPNLQALRDWQVTAPAFSYLQPAEGGGKRVVDQNSGYWNQVFNWLNFVKHLQQSADLSYNSRPLRR